MREAREVLVLADSMRAEVMMYNDSVRLANTYESLGRWSLLFPTDFAHACYHYGRLLREKDNPVAAMECFINATHTRTHDYSILGRTYSNMGSLCHLACAYPLAYDMYEKSADMFLRDGDTILYYYALYREAIELAEQGDKEACFAIVENIKSNCSHDNVLISYCYMTKARAFFVREQYDSVIVYARQTIQYLPLLSSGNLLMAQAFSKLGIKDSSTYYAHRVIEQTNSLLDINNALYILTNDDTSKGLDDVRQTAADRSDVQQAIKDYQGKLSQAVQLLEQDFEKKPDWRWLYAIVFTSLIIGGIFYWRIKSRKRHMQIQLDHLTEQQTDTITQSIKQHINKNDLTSTLHWKDYNALKADADLFMYGIVSKLEERRLNETEVRFCILTMLDFSLSEIAETIYYSYPSGIKTLKKRISVKLGTTPQNLHDFLFKIAIGI